MTKALFWFLPFEGLIWKANKLLAKLLLKTSSSTWHWNIFPWKSGELFHILFTLQRQKLTFRRKFTYLLSISFTHFFSLTNSNTISLSHTHTNTLFLSLTHTHKHTQTHTLFFSLTNSNTTSNTHTNNSNWVGLNRINDLLKFLVKE